MPKLGGLQIKLVGIVLFGCSMSAVFGQTTTVLSGRVVDPSGSAVSDATIVLENAVTQFFRTLQSASNGDFAVANIPFQSYQLRVERDGFVPSVQTLSLRSTIPTNIEVKLEIATSVQ